MNASQYLGQIAYLDYLLENKENQIEKFRERATTITSCTEATGIHASGISDKVGNAVASYVTLQKEIEADIAEALAVRKRIIADIEKLPASEYMVIYGIYVDKLDYFTLGEKADRSYRWVVRQKSNGLKHIQEILDERGDS